MRVAKRNKQRPGHVRDAILTVLSAHPDGASIADISAAIAAQVGSVPASSVRSYLRLNTPHLFVKKGRGWYALGASGSSLNLSAAPYAAKAPFIFKDTELIHTDCLLWLRSREENTIHAVVTDPPYGLVEYSDQQQAKLRSGRGGIWRIPPSFDGSRRSPLPRFTVLGARDIEALEEFFAAWARALMRVLVPGANVLVASNPLLSYVVSHALARSGLERRGEVVRLVMTMRGGDRPKAAHEEFTNVSVMPRSMWEPWLVYRKPLEGRVQDNLRKWKTGGFRRPSSDRPFGDVIPSAPTRKSERAVAPHPSLKPQSFLRQLVRAALPLGEGVVLDPFAGAGSTLAAAAAVGYRSLGVEKDVEYFDVACKAIPRLSALKV